MGYNNVKQFIDEKKLIKKFGNICWYTNLEIKKRNKPIDLVKKYNSIDYPKYDNYDAININKIKDIPCDYYDVMGVPISLLEKYAPEQFEIVGIAAGNTKVNGFYYSVPYLPHPKDRGGCGVINGKRIYTRILIKRKK